MVFATYTSVIFSIKASNFYESHLNYSKQFPFVCVLLHLLISHQSSHQAKMPEPGSDKDTEENNQLRPHSSETFTDVAAQTVDTINAGKNVSSKFREQRYTVSILVLVSLMLATCLVQAMASSTNRALQIVTLLCSLCLAFYIYQWVFYFSDGLTQRKRAYFDVRNVLLTYQPNKFTDKAELFHPDPPTPSVSAVPPTDADRWNGNGQSNSRIKDMKAGEFYDWRNEYYKDEYTHAMEINRRQNSVPLYAPTDGQVKIHNGETSNDTQEELSKTREDELKAANEENKEQQPEPTKDDHKE